MHGQERTHSIDVLAGKPTVLIRSESSYPYFNAGA